MQQAYKPDSVSYPENQDKDFCHLSNRPTPRHKTGHLQASVYMAFQPRRQTAPAVSNKAGGLLLHLFTLISPRYYLDGTVIFCSALIPLQVSFFQEVWYPCCPDFPLALASDRTTCCTILISNPIQEILKSLHIHIQDRKHPGTWHQETDYQELFLIQI